MVPLVGTGRFVLCRPRAGLYDVLAQIAACWDYARTYGRALVIDTTRAQLPLPLEEFLEVEPTADGPPLVRLGLSGWRPPSAARILPEQLPDAIDYESVRETASRAGEMYRERASRAPITFDFSVDHPHTVLVHEQGGRDPRASRMAARLRLNERMRDEVCARLDGLPPAYDAIHIRNTDLRSDHVPFLLDLRRALGARPVLVCSDDAGTVADAKLLLDSCEVLTLSEIPQTTGRGLHQLPETRGWGSAKDQFTDLIALSCATELFLCPTRTHGAPTGFGLLASDLKWQWAGARPFVDRPRLPNSSDVTAPMGSGSPALPVASALELLRGARTHLRMGRVDEAIAGFRALLQRIPGDARALTGLGLAHRAAGNHVEALESFRHALRSKPRDPNALRHVLRQELLLGMHEDALRTAERGRVVAPDDPTFVMARARALESTLPAAAGAAWDEAVSVAPTDPGVVLGAARWRTQHHDPAAATVVLRHALAAGSPDERLHLRLARSELELGRGREALEVLGSIDAGSLSLARGSARQAAELRVRAHLLLADESSASAILAAFVGGDSATSATDRAWASTWSAEVAAAGWRLESAQELMQHALELEPTLARAKRLAQFRLAALDPFGAQDAWRVGSTLAQERAPRDADVPWRVSSGLIGDLINELLLDPEATAEARAALIANDVGAARSLVRRAPNSHAAATALLVVLRRTGHFDVLAATERASVGTHAAVPDRLHQAWLGSAVPEDVQRLVSRWEGLHPTWEHRLIDDRSALDLIHRRARPGEREAFAAAPSPTWRADLLRLILLDEFGGFWVDADDLPLGALDDLRSPAGFVAVQEPFGALGNHLIGAGPDHPAVTGALEEVVQNLRAGARESPWLASGPGPLTRAFARHLADERLGVPRRDGDGVRPSVRVLDMHERDRLVSASRRMSYKATDRWWRNRGA